MIWKVTEPGFVGKSILSPVFLFYQLEHREKWEGKRIYNWHSRALVGEGMTSIMIKRKESRINLMVI